MSAPNRVKPINALTVIITTAWLVSFIARLIAPSLTFGPAVDTAMLLTLGYWFSFGGTRKNGNGNGA